MGPQVGWDGISGNPQGGANSVNQVDGDSDVEPTCQLCGEWAQERNNDLCQYFCLGESCPSSSCPEARDFSSSSYVPGTFQAAASVLELRTSESE